MLHVVKMVQNSRYRWTLVSPKGSVLAEDLMMASPYKAEEWVKGYISSFNGWTYAIVLLTKQEER